MNSAKFFHVLFCFALPHLLLVCSIVVVDDDGVGLMVMMSSVASVSYKCAKNHTNNKEHCNSTLTEQTRRVASATADVSKIHLAFFNS